MGYEYQDGVSFTDDDGDGPSYTVFGYPLLTVILVAIFFFAVFFLLTYCWNYCTGENEKKDSKSSNENRETVIAREIRPGLIVIQGTSEETIRIIQEYEAIRNETVGTSTSNYGSLYTDNTGSSTSGLHSEAIPGTSYGSFYSDTGGAHAGGAHTGSAHTGGALHNSSSQQRLLEFDSLTQHNRPPPYAPSH